MAREKKSSMNLDPELLEALTKMKDNMVAMSELVLMQAKLHKEKYNACIEEGFTKGQALELCKQIFMK